MTTPETTMIERIARTMLAAHYDYVDPPNDTASLFDYRRSLYVATATLKQLRNPDSTMLAAGADTLFGSASDDWKEDALAIFQAMIDEALGENKSG